MKRILNNIGAISKQAIVGGAITVATLVVGVGLINNFSSKSGSEQGFASNALERSGYSYDFDSNYESTSAQDILSARDYAQGQGDGKVAITGTENLLLNKRNSGKTAAVAQGQAGEVGTVQDDSQAYATGELEGMGTSNKVAVNVGEEDEAAAAAKAKAHRDAKIAKGQALGDKARATLKTSKMADSSGIAGIVTGSTSMAFNAGTAVGGSMGANDSSKIALGQAGGGLANVNLQGAKGGKLGGMGTKGVEAEGARAGRSALGRHEETLGDLSRASKYSKSGKQAVSSDMAKGAQDAASAFDGSKEADVVSLQGDNLQKAALNTLSDMGDPDLSGLNDLQDELNEIDETMNKYADLIDKITDCIWAMVLSASIASIAVGIFSKIEPWGAVAALAAAAAGTAAILASQIAAAAYLGQINDLAASSGIDSIKPTAWEFAQPWVIGGFLAGLVWLAWGLAGMSTSEVAQAAQAATEGGAEAGEAAAQAGAQAASKGAKAAGIFSQGMNSLGSSGFSSALQRFFAKIGGKKH